jgi:non-specific serine/threonine protein kinase
MLDGETDVGYFDSFESAEDMAKYAEVFKKQRDVEAVQEKGLGNRNNWVGSSLHQLTTSVKGVS